MTTGTTSREITLLEADRKKARRVARELATTLQEPNLPGLTRVVMVCGEPQARAWLSETQQIETNGGMLTGDGQRQRTAGGIYFKLVKDFLYKTDYNKLRYVFRPPSSGSTRKEGAAPPPATMKWSERNKLIRDVPPSERGVAFTVKVTLIGKLGKTIEKAGFTLAMMSSRPRLNAMPKGIPLPEKVPTTQYIIYIGGEAVAACQRGSEES